MLRRNQINYFRHISFAYVRPNGEQPQKVQNTLGIESLRIRRIIRFAEEKLCWLVLFFLLTSLGVEMNI